MGDIETAWTVGELKEILDGYGDDDKVVAEGRGEVHCNVEVEDANGIVVIRAGLPVDA